MKKIKNSSINLYEEIKRHVKKPYQKQIWLALSVLAYFDCKEDSLILFYLIFQDTPQAVVPLMLWIREQLSNGVTEDQITYPLLMSKAIEIASNIREKILI